MKPFDAVVVGAGLAGLQCALELLRRGRRVLIVDRKDSPSQVVHTTGILVRRTLEDFEFPADLLGPVVRHVTLHSPSGRTLDLASPHEEFRVGDMGRIYQRMLDEAFSRGIEYLPSTHFVRSESVSPNSGDALARVHLETAGRAVIAMTRFVIGADGAASRVAVDLGLSRNESWIVGVEQILSGVPLEGPPRFHCFLDPRLAPGYIAWLVHDGREVHLGVGGYPSKFRPEAALNQFRELAGKRFDLSRARIEEIRGGRIPVGGVLPRIASERGLLVGDAAGAVSPLTAGGLDGAMRLSRFAAETLSTSFDEGISPAALYSGEAFRARFISRLWMRRVLAALDSTHALNAGFALARLPGFRGIAWHLFFGRGSFPDAPVRRGVLGQQSI